MFGPSDKLIKLLNMAIEIVYSSAFMVVIFLEKMDTKKNRTIDSRLEPDRMKLTWIGPQVSTLSIHCPYMSKPKTKQRRCSV